MTVAISSGLGALALIGIMVVADEARAQNRCQSLKWKAAGVAAKMKAACYASAAKEGVDVDPACLAKADARLAKRWSAAEEAGGCVTTGDLAAASGAVDQCRRPRSAPWSRRHRPPRRFAAISAPRVRRAWASTRKAASRSSAERSDRQAACATVQPARVRRRRRDSGRCCMSTSVSFCTGGPNLDLSGCVPPSFLDFPFAVCSPSGACLLP